MAKGDRSEADRLFQNRCSEDLKRAMGLRKDRYSPIQIPKDVFLF